MGHLGRKQVSAVHTAKDDGRVRLALLHETLTSLSWLYSTQKTSKQTPWITLPLKYWSSSMWHILALGRGKKTLFFYQHLVLFWVFELSYFKFLSFVTFWVFLVLSNFYLLSCHILSFWIWSQFEFSYLKVFSFVTFWVFDFLSLVTFSVLSHFESFSFVTFWVFEFYHIWVLSDFKFLSSLTHSLTHMIECMS